MGVWAYSVQKESFNIDTMQKKTFLLDTLEPLLKLAQRWLVHLAPSSKTSDKIL